MKRCTKCGLEKDESCFSLKNRNGRGRLSSQCKNCMAQAARERYKRNIEFYKEKNKKAWPKYRQRNHEYVLKYLSTHPCVDCGEADLEVLEFDHIEPLLGKGSRVSNLSSSSIERLQEEIDKCEVRCANCHTRRTRRMNGWLRASVAQR